MLPVKLLTSIITQTHINMEGLLSPMFIAKSLSFYKQQKVQEELVRHAKDKEVAVRFQQGMGRRPDVLNYPNDVLELAKKGVSSFHASEELWKNPLALKPGMRREELDSLRKGWDLIIDVDCKIFEYSKIATHYIIKALKHYKVNSITAKFSGNKGFHVAVPWEAFPEKIGQQHTKNLFPEVPQRIALLIKESIKKPVTEALTKLEKGEIQNIVKKINDKNVIEYREDRSGNKMPVLNIEPFLAIDTILISSRHMYRMPYSLHEKSGLVSTPVDIEKILQFKKQEAKPENASFKHKFIERKTCEKGEASILLREAYDFAPQIENLQEKSKAKPLEDYFDKDLQKIPEEFFPPSIKKLLFGLEDGRKRGVFILITFLSNVGWSYEEIEQRIYEWNKKNTEPLRETYIKGQLRYYKNKKSKTTPPGYDNKAYYTDLGVYSGEMEKENIKNPLQYVKKRIFLIKKQQKQAKKEAKQKNKSNLESTQATNQPKHL